MSWLKGLFGFGAGTKVSGPEGSGVALSAPQKPTAAPKFVTATAIKSTVGDDDDRDQVSFGSLRKKPWCAICCLECEFENGTFTGTGSLIDARTIITAAHNLWNPPEDPDEPGRAVGKVRSIKVTPARWDAASGGPFGSKLARRFAYDSRWQTERDPTRRFYDYGVIFLDKPGFKLPFYLPMWELALDKWQPSLVLNCAGYPFDMEGHFVTASGGVGSEKPGGAVFLGPKNEMIIHGIDTEGGESGAPIFWGDKTLTDFYVLAIHTQGVGLVSGRNAGVRITTGMMKEIDRWRSDPGTHGPQQVVPHEPQQIV
jgi:V8-like Glu-specific endopeptidase